jgi:hypothetical protein
MREQLAKAREARHAAASACTAGDLLTVAYPPRPSRPRSRLTPQGETAVETIHLGKTALARSRPRATRVPVTNFRSTAVYLTAMHYDRRLDSIAVLRVGA